MSPEEITPAWLTRALGHPVASVEILDQHAGTTGRARLHLSGAGAALPEHLFAKLPPGDPNQRLMVQATGMGRNEARFYAELAATLPLRLPRPWFGAWSEDGAAYAMLMEDLVAAGCTFPDLVAGPTLDFAERVVTALGRLHARFWDDPRFAAELSWIEPPARHEVGPTLVARALELFAEELPPSCAELGRLYVAHTPEVHDAWEQGETTLLHGDAHLANLFADGEDAGFLDWGCIARGPGMRDISHFLTSSLPPATRRSQERALIERYRAAVGECAPDFAEAWRRHRLHAAYTWVAASVTLAMGDEWQPFAYAREALARANAAVAELDSLGALREALGA